jgi:hypothetical protein
MLQKVFRLMRFLGVNRRPLGPALATAITVLCAIALTRCGGGSTAQTQTTTQTAACGQTPGSESLTNPALPGMYALSPGPAGTFFGINANGLKDPWPGTAIPVSSWRSLGGDVKWADINTGSGTYNFTKLDQWLSEAKASNTDVLFTAYATPSWASSRGKNSASPNT